MSKGSGTTRASTTASPRGLSPSMGNIRIGRTDTIDKTDRLHREFGDSFAVPVYEFEARNYYNTTGTELPDDAVKIVFGRGAADGSIFSETLATPQYENIRVIEADIRPYPGGRADNTTFITGYDSLEQLKAFVKDVDNGTVRSRYEKLQRRWNHR